MIREFPPTLSMLLAAASLVASAAAPAHNNPTFREDLLVKVQVPADRPSEPFSLELPKGAVQLIFRVDPPDAPVSFSLRQGGESRVDALAHDGTANITNGDDFTLVATDGASGQFDVSIVAKVLDRSAQQDATDVAAGRKIYQSANCVGCHKWHGDGGGGYGGAALSLRKTGLEREHLIEVVRCGRPATRMPAHTRGAYTQVVCYGGLSAEFLGDKMPPKARRTLRDESVEAVVDYVIAKLKGRGTPSKAECVEYWGEKSQACARMK